jgi:hypothetical protein
MILDFIYNPFYQTLLSEELPLCEILQEEV